jgi:uncharacterized protein (TIGR02231 family)
MAYRKEKNMKSLIRLMLLCAISTSWAQTNRENITKPEIKDVTLYAQGANIKSIKRESVQSGTSVIEFKGLSNYIDANSVQVKCDAAITILSVNYELSYLNPQETQRLEKIIKDSIETVQAEIQKLESQIASIDIEESILNANLKVSGENTGLNTSELEKLINISTKRMLDCRMRKIEVQQQITKKQLVLNRLRQQSGNNRREQPSGEIKVAVRSDRAVDCKFEIEYFVTNCGWTPVYDVRVKDIASPVQLVARANVYQQTGEDWKNVNLHLSTGNPARGGVKPELFTWFSSLISEQVKQTTGNRNRYDDFSGAAPTTLKEVQISSAPKKAKEEEKSLSSYDYTEVNTSSATNVTFDINLPFSIKSDGKKSLVDIQYYDMKAEYSYSCAPKLDPDVFLIASITNWDKPELLPGEASIFFENTYVGKSYFNTQNTNDTIQFSLGRDNNITVKRMLIKEFKEKAGVNQANKITRTYEIEVRNKRKQKIDLLIEDHIPVSQNEQLEIKLEDDGKAQYEKETGMLKWKLKLEPSQQQKIKYVYSAKYPKKLIPTNF